MWLCLALSLATSIAWLASARWTMFFIAQFGDSYDLKAGCISHSWTSQPLREKLSAKFNEPMELSWEWHLAPRKVPMEWFNPFYITRPTGRSMIILPLWIPFFLFAGLAGAFYWLCPRFVHPGCCNTCGYNLSGLAPSSPCPECASNQNFAAIVVARVRWLAITLFRFAPPFTPQSISTPPHTHC